MRQMTKCNNFSGEATPYPIFHQEDKFAKADIFWLEKVVNCNCYLPEKVAVV